MTRIRQAISLLPILISMAAFSHGVFAESELCVTGADGQKPVSVHCGETPSATFGSDGSLWVTFVQDEHVYVSRSMDAGASYSLPIMVNQEAENIEFNGENRPKIIVNGDEIYLTWTLKTSPQFTGEIRFSRSTDGGRSYSSPRTVNDDNLFAGHRFESLFLTEAGQLFVTWIDKRDLEAATEEGQEYSGAAVYYAVSSDGGASFSQNYRVSNHSCECCRIAIAPRGRENIAILWRQIFGVTTRDHAIAVLTPEGEMLESHRASYDDWQINACPHHGPSMVQSASDSDAYHISWFTNGDLHQGVYYGRFEFATGKPTAVRQIDGNPGAGHPYLATTDDTVFLVWKGFDGKQSLLQMMLSKDDGENWSEPETLAVTSQASDHPLLLTLDDTVYLSWKSEELGYVFKPLAAMGSSASD